VAARTHRFYRLLQRDSTKVVEELWSGQGTAQSPDMLQFKPWWFFQKPYSRAWIRDFKPTSVDTVHAAWRRGRGGNGGAGHDNWCSPEHSNNAPMTPSVLLRLIRFPAYQFCAIFITSGVLD
jgi:hypothetical protein